jgi:hypothetical protein
MLTHMRDPFGFGEVTAHLDSADHFSQLGS